MICLLCNEEIKDNQSGVCTKADAEGNGEEFHLCCLRASVADSIGHNTWAITLINPTATAKEIYEKTWARPVCDHTRKS